jgi:nitrogenase molybdenum-iron protein alpha/beta subunit
MKNEINSALVKTLAALITGQLAVIDKEERKLVNILGEAWLSFIVSKDGGEEHWTYYNEDGSVKRHGVLEFRNAALAAAEKGGYSRTYMSDILRDVSDDFVLRKSAPRPRKAKVKFSEAQLESVGKAALAISLTKTQVKELLAALMA